jgi:hypothetical protein
VIGLGIPLLVQYLVPRVTRAIPPQRSPGTASLRMITLKTAAKPYSSAVRGSTTVTADQDRAATNRT